MDRRLQSDTEVIENFGPNFGPLRPKHHRKPGNIRDQRARRINKIENFAKSAKPPSPVQIRAAPPTLQRSIEAKVARRRAKREGGRINGLSASVGKPKFPKKFRD